MTDVFKATSSLPMRSVEFPGAAEPSDLGRVAAMRRLRWVAERRVRRTGVRLGPAKLTAPRSSAFEPLVLSILTDTDFQAARQTMPPLSADRCAARSHCARCPIS